MPGVGILAASEDGAIWSPRTALLNICVRRDNVLKYTQKNDGPPRECALGEKRQPFGWTPVDWMEYSKMVTLK
jgi:hypothetical protein